MFRPSFGHVSQNFRAQNLAPGGPGPAQAAGRPRTAQCVHTLHIEAPHRTMLYKFKSQAAGELIMLEPAGRRMLEIVGKDASPAGILTLAQLPAAIAALQAAIAAEEAAGSPSAAVEDELAEARARNGDAPAGDSMGLRRRSKPFMDFLRRSLKEESDVVWGV